jgi:hypothetical protein
LPFEQHRAHACRHADAIGNDIALQKVHRVVNRHAARHDPARRIDVEMDVFFGILHLQIEHLGNDQIGDHVVDRRSEKNNPVFQQP